MLRRRHGRANDRARSRSAQERVSGFDFTCSGQQRAGRGCKRPRAACSSPRFANSSRRPASCSRCDRSPAARVGGGCERLTAERVAVQKGELTFADFLIGHDWYADARALTLFSHWITPPSEPRRYNTHFFFAVAPPNQAALADAYETHDGIWIAPSRALELHREGTLHLVYPTIKHLERLSSFASVDDALRFARSKPVLTIMPAANADDFAIPPALENAW